MLCSYTNISLSFFAISVGMKRRKSSLLKNYEIVDDVRYVSGTSSILTHILRQRRTLSSQVKGTFNVNNILS
ncbi:hypothetical protein [Fischerella thermalis]|uniref:hypothetical protein n=2 Tax=Fischerella thermalis TaxID=372787 RepID=UPI001A008B1E|nr:hypothetical protein [Fischerella thermalis]MBF1989853.1 hypothetical protein [Fischerella thermalis M58_A2018_009]